MATTKAFKKELAALINTHSLEGDSLTPDYILADYMCSCLEGYVKTVLSRDTWHNTQKTFPGEFCEAPHTVVAAQDRQQG